MTIDQIQDLVSTLGIPTAILLAMIWIVLRLGRWIGPRAARIVEHHIDFLLATQEHQAKQTETLSQQSEMIGTTCRALSHFADAADGALDSNIEETKNSIERAREELDPR